jgi:TonB family protein
MVRKHALGLALVMALLISCGRSRSTGVEDRRGSRTQETSGTANPRTPTVHEQTSHCDFSPFKPVRISDWLPQGVIKQVKPVYPLDAKSQSVHGRVLVHVLINLQGEVEQACGTGHPLLTRAAEDAALGWKFRTPLLNGRKFPVYIHEFLSFDFVLDEPGPKVSR